LSRKPVYEGGLHLYPKIHKFKKSIDPPSSKLLEGGNRSSCLANTLDVQLRRHFCMCSWWKSN